MSPFLAQVQVINVAGSAERSADSVIEAVRAVTNKALDEARASADAAVKGARVSSSSDDDEDAPHAKTAASDKDDASDGDKTVRIDKNGVTVVHHKKSSGDDVPAIVVPIVAIFFVFSYLIVKAVMAPFTNRNKRGPQVTVAAGLSEEETVLLEKLQRTLVQMESRVESLETILIDQSRTKEKYGTKL